MSRRKKPGKPSAKIFVWTAVLGFTALILLLVVAGMMDPRGTPAGQTYVDDSQ